MFTKLYGGHGPVYLKFSRSLNFWAIWLTAASKSASAWPARLRQAEKKLVKPRTVSPNEKLNVAAIGALPVTETFSVFGKFGFFAWEVEASDTTAGIGAFTAQADGTNASFGLGVSYNFAPNLGVRAEWERFRVELLDEADDEGPAQVDDQRAVRELAAKPLSGDRRGDIPQQGADRSAKCDEQGALHLVESSLMDSESTARSATTDTKLARPRRRRLLCQKHGTRCQSDDALCRASHDAAEDHAVVARGHVELLAPRDVEERGLVVAFPLHDELHRGVWREVGEPDVVRSIEAALAAALDYQLWVREVRGGRRYAVDCAVLATGNIPNHDAAAHYFGNPWNPQALAGLDPDVLSVLEARAERAGRCSWAYGAAWDG